MKRTALALALFASLALGSGVQVECRAATSDLAKLTPMQLLELLKEPSQAGLPVFVISEPLEDWVREEHLPALMELLDSTEECRPVLLAPSSVLPLHSTVGQEAAFMVHGFRAGRYPPALYSGHPSLASKEELLSWWTARCPRADAIKTMPFRDEHGIDAAYDKLRFEDACESELLVSLNDVRTMADPRQMPPDERFTVADAALFILLDRRSLAIEQVLPDDVAARMKGAGISAYFDYVATPQGRSEVVDRAKRLVVK